MRGSTMPISEGPISAHPASTTPILTAPNSRDFLCAARACASRAWRRQISKPPISLARTSPMQRLSEANLRAANLRNARLDYADFAGADLSEANLRGANLQNAKNLTRSQLEQSLGDASTILPEHLQGSVAWSPARGETAPVAPMLAPSFVVRRAYEIPFLQATAVDRGVRLDHGIRGGCVVAVRRERSKSALEHRPRTLGAEGRPIAGIHGAADNRSTRRCASRARRRS